MSQELPPEVAHTLRHGVVIPASPLALNAQRKFDERRQRALWRYYAAAGAGGIAVGVHTTQFAIRDPQIGLYEPLLALAREEFDQADGKHPEPMVRVAGICGRTDQATREAASARDFGFHAALLSLAAMRDANEDALIRHCRAVAEVMPLFGFYLQPAVGGIDLGYRFWRRFAEIENVVAIKVAAFNRYRTLDVVRAIAESGREEIALYTGNDDNIMIDLLTPYQFTVEGTHVERRFVGGLLGHWAVWTHKAVEMLKICHVGANRPEPIPEELLQHNVEVTDANAAVFDAANNFAGCIPGIHEVLRRQGLLEGIWCLDSRETLSPGQAEEIDRVVRSYPHLIDDHFVAQHLDEWLA
jgi:hypothetical protein